MTLAEALEAGLGWCTNCEDWTTEDVDPEVEDLECDQCLCRNILGAQVAYDQGLIPDDYYDCS